jgi:glycosyltransferase involved in cell wall biosynthesis
MAVGRPVVATGTGGAAEYMRDGENCLVYSPRDSAEALATRVMDLAAAPELRERLRDGGFATAAAYTESSYNERIRDESIAVASGAGG